MKQVICKSGLKGWQARVRKVYESLEDLRAWDQMYGIASRLGYTTPEALWEANPTIRGSVEPGDLEVVKV
jgi:hypothetical protein